MEKKGFRVRAELIADYLGSYKYHITSNEVTGSFFIEKEFLIGKNSLYMIALPYPEVEAKSIVLRAKAELLADYVSNYKYHFISDGITGSFFVKRKFFQKKKEIEVVFQISEEM